ncbi:hypothetical protein WJX81_002980 [Elliptochloris bilobata]|uniref:Uncharacterized protein n=1 Tax=Elliptochloris bilobata TaxID=381761 RepID=A0AAW1SKY8_9CHLO
MDITTVLIDLDGTLYDIENGYEEHVRQNVFRFMVERLGVRDVATARMLWQEHFRVYNQSLRALRAARFSFDTSEYWDFIRAGASDFLRPNPALRALLESLPQEKWVFTNCSEKHCHIALELLGLQGCFAGVIGADAMGDAAKPAPTAFATAFKAMGELRPGTHIAMFEDSAKNLATAKALGLTTLLGHPGPPKNP